MGCVERNELVPGGEGRRGGAESGGRVSGVLLTMVGVKNCARLTLSFEKKLGDHANGEGFGVIESAGEFKIFFKGKSERFKFLVF